MAKKKKDYATEYAEKILKLLPEAVREQAKATLTPDQIVEALGGDLDTLEQVEQKLSEAATKNQEADAYKGRLDQWYADNQKLIADGSAALAKLAEGDKGVGDKPPNPSANIPPQNPNDPKSFVTREEAIRVLTEAVARTQQDAMQFGVIVNELALRHLHEYKEPLDVRGLIAYAQKERKFIDAAYPEFTKEKREAREAQVAKEKEQKLREQIRADLVKEMGSAPYPVVSEEPSTLSGLQSKDGKKPEYGVQAALDDFYARGQQVGRA